MKTYAEINEKIKKGTAVVLTAEEVSELSKSLTPKEIAQNDDISTRGRVFVNIFFSASLSSL